MKIILRKKDGVWDIPEVVACDNCGVADNCKTVILIDELFHQSQFTACPTCLRKIAIAKLIEDLVPIIVRDKKVSMLEVRQLFDTITHATHRRCLPDINQLVNQIAPDYGWNMVIEDGRLMLLPTPMFYKKFPL